MRSCDKLMRKAFKYLLTFIAIFSADRITKWLAVKYLRYNDITVFSNLDLSFTWNRGVTWGLFGRSGNIGFYLLSALVAVVIIFFGIYTFVQHREGETVFFELFVLSGAISNFFDRIYYGAVVDFIDFHVLGWHWPAFNIADACIVIGVGGIVLRGLLCAFRKK